ncbi:glycoside hydrolase family 81 protein [Pleomassaria siparia CBS 279.74]|uniref:glucan endo-1,3-beta-D-glucosidase n=1 Tax=Pleomassaria siparia CBS 279.74 TaxID=1314801 RepID=A0A6G1K0Z2_9PLEO|nr:glycoside hydrolase family 81 protein [Pleomassaria siparia CBS 279.74]
MSPPPPPALPPTLVHTVHAIPKILSTTILKYSGTATKIPASSFASFPPPLLSPTTTSMGLSQSSLQKPLAPSSNKFSKSLRKSWTSYRGTSTLTVNATAVIPEGNIFVPIQQDNILPQIPIGTTHPVARKGIEDDDKRTLHTNKFYANSFLGGQDQPIWTHPYFIWWGKGSDENGQFPTWGMNIAHDEEGDRIIADGDPPKSYINPKKQSLILSAQELDPSTTMTTDTHLPFSVNINLKHRMGTSEPRITFPVVQGMSFVTGRYINSTPVIHCPGDGFRSISHAIFVGRLTKYRIVDNEGRNWVMYINPVLTQPYDTSAFRQIDRNTLVGPSDFKGTIQVAKNPSGDDIEKLYDKASGSFVTEAMLTGTVTDQRGTYSLNYTKIGTSPLLMFVLPHHMESLDPELKSAVTKLRLSTTTKGIATAVWADKLTFIETALPTTMGFAPWTPTIGASKIRYPQGTLDLLAITAEQDLQRSMNSSTPPDSMYYAGKTLAKFATILWVMKDVLSATSPQYPSGLGKLKFEMAKYVENRQQYPLYYDDSWKGVVSYAGFIDPGADFGNTFYNDHHFHFGYFVYACAVIAYLDPEWLTQGHNKEWVNMLVKDYAESDYNGRDYPFFRSFDWYNGHSWAKGLFESANGKDEESTSEDGFASFAVKMWGKVIGDVDMEKRGNLMLAIQARSFNNYFYLQENNTNHPARFIPNKVTGILYENKVDHATYFGLAPELIHGIHMLPLSPPSQLLRTRPFVKEEWDRFFSSSNSNSNSNSNNNDGALVPGGWRGILYANLALIDAKTAYTFFRDGIRGVWEEGWIDNGASRTWYLVWCAGLGGGR